MKWYASHLQLSLQNVSYVSSILDFGFWIEDLELAQERDIPLMALRFEEDWISPCARFDELKKQD